MIVRGLTSNARDAERGRGERAQGRARSRVATVSSTDYASALILACQRGIDNTGTRRESPLALCALVP